MWIKRAAFVCTLCALASALPAQSPEAPPSHAALFAAFTARGIGPVNMSGRISAVAVDEGNPDVVYVGAATGGVWKTTDGCKTWAPIFDEAGSLCIGDVAVCRSKPNVVWVGTGEHNVIRSTSCGDGVYK